MGSRRLTVRNVNTVFRTLTAFPNPEARKHETFSTRNSSVFNSEHSKIRLCFLTRAVSFEDKLPVKNRALIPRSAEPLCCSKVYHCLPANINTTRIQKKCGRSQYSDWATLWSTEEIWLDSRQAERDFSLHTQQPDHLGQPIQPPIRYILGMFLRR